MQAKIQEINFLQITEEQKNLLYHFLKQELEDPKKQFWMKNFQYHYQSEVFTLNQDLIRVRRKKNKPGLRFAIIDPNIYAEGGPGKVHKILTIVLDKDGIRIKTEEKRVTKCLGIPPKLDEEMKQKNLADIYNEHQITDKVGYLGVKEPTIVEINGVTFAFLPMKRMKGRDLQELTRNIDDLDILSKFKFSINLCEALRDQVAIHKVVHRDLRNVNLMVDLSTLAVKVIDYGKSIDLEAKSTSELPVLLDPQLDLVSLGLVLQDIWFPYLDQLQDSKLKESLVALLHEMQLGFEMLFSTVDPTRYNADGLKALMGENHGFIHYADKLYYVHFDGKLTELTKDKLGQTLIIKKSPDTLSTLEVDEVINILRSTGFDPKEPLKKKNLHIEDCILRLKQLSLQYQTVCKGTPASGIEKSVSEIKTEVKAEAEVNHDHEPTKNKNNTKELIFAMDKIGLFSGYQSPRPILTSSLCLAPEMS